MRKKKKWSVISICMLLVGLGLVAASLSLMVPTLLDYKKSNDTYEDLKDKYVVISQAPQSDSGTSSSEGTSGENAGTEDGVQEVTGEVVNENWWYEEVDIQLDRLRQENGDIIGWILFEHNDNISYPVLYSGDNETYLRTDIYGNHTTAGCIFMEGACTPDFEDYHTIIYGHNMKNLSMFGSLRNYKNDGYYNGHQYFMIYTDDMAYRYQIFAYYDIPETDDVYQVGFGSDDTYQAFLNEMKRHSYHDTGITVTKEDKVITLSTCSMDGYRFVVHGVRVAEHSY